LKLLQVLGDTASKIAPGRAPYFVEAHIVKALTTIDSQGPVGRAKLAETLGLGEGIIRTLIRHLEKEELIEVSRQGIALTSLGENFVSSMRSSLGQAVEIPQCSLTVGAFNVAILVRRAAQAVRTGLEQRDAAIKVGALGATTLIFDRGRLTMPHVNGDVFRNVPRIHEVLASQLKPEENDVIVIGSANDGLTAEFGAIAAALETLKAHRFKAEK